VTRTREPQGNRSDWKVTCITLEIGTEINVRVTEVFVEKYTDHR
jgi:hypothetical protein